MVSSLITPAFSSPFTDTVANDYYNGTAVNGIPTAWDNPGSTNQQGQTIGKPNIYEAVNEILGTNYTSNTEIDFMFVDNDFYWLNFGGQATVIGYSAYYLNDLGVYSSVDNHDVLSDQSGQGFAPGFPNAAIGVDDGITFGWYLNATRRNGEYVGTYYSDSTLNNDGYDHMMTFDLGGGLDFNGNHYENPYLIAWEDKPLGYYKIPNTLTLGDEDYNDLIFLVDASPTDVPEPGTIFLLGSGLLGLAGWKKRKNLA